MLGLAVGLKKRGHAVTLMITGNKYLPGKKKEKLPVDIKGVCIAHTPSLPDSFIVMPGMIQGILALLFLVVVKTPLVFLRALKHDVVYCSKPLPYGAIVAFLSSRLARKPMVLDTDDWEGVGGFATIKQGRRAIVKTVITYFEEKLPLLCKAVVPVSKLLADRIMLSGVPPEAVIIAPNGADINRYNPSVNGRAVREKYSLSGTVLSYVGTFKKGGANWKMLVDSYSVVAKAMPDTKLLVIGFGDELDDARAYCSSIGVDKQVVFTDRVDNEFVPEYLAASDICLLPYQDDFPHTFLNIGRSSLKLYEYMAMGKPVVATAVGEVKEALKDGGGIIVRTNDANDFGRAIVDFLSRPESERIAVGREARRRAETVYNYDALSGVAEKALLYAMRNK
jgi:glycosyltransferase involved in cell wall biosynthesis